MGKQEITRRDFIKGIAAGAVSFAALGALQGVDHVLEGKKVEASANAAAAAAAQAVADASPSGLTFTPAPMRLRHGASAAT